jgi:hypothetical protein
MTQTEREKRLGLQLPVEVQGEDLSGARFEERTSSVNVSGGGILFESSRPLAVGARLLLAIELPPGLRRHFGDAALYRVRAVVCRVEHVEGSASSRVAARFLAEAGAEPVL